MTNHALGFQELMALAKNEYERVQLQRWHDRWILEVGAERSVTQQELDAINANGDHEAYWGFYRDSCLRRMMKELVDLGQVSESVVKTPRPESGPAERRIWRFKVLRRYPA